MKVTDRLKRLDRALCELTPNMEYTVRVSGGQVEVTPYAQDSDNPTTVCPPYFDRSFSGETLTEALKKLEEYLVDRSESLRAVLKADYS